MDKYFDVMKRVTNESDNKIQNTLNTTFSRTTREFIDDLSTKWNDYDSETKARIGIEISGMFNLSRFVGLMNGLSESK